MVLFGFSIISQLHFLNFMTYFISHKDVYSEAVLIIGKYWDKEIISSEYIKFAKANNVKVFFDIDRKVVLNDYMKNSKELDFVFVNNVSIKIAVLDFLGLNVNKIIIVDEGISSYASETHRHHSIIREKGYAWFLIRHFFNRITNFYFFLKEKKVFFFKIFDIKSLEVNPEYQKTFIKILKEIYVERNFVNTYEGLNIVLFCSQPYVDLGMITSEKYKQEMLHLKKRVEKKGMQLVVKKHPAENLFNYNSIGIPCLHFNGAIEEFLANEKVKCLISKSSTSSLLAGSLLKVNSYVISYDELKHMGGILDDLYRKYCMEVKDFDHTIDIKVDVS